MNKLYGVIDKATNNLITFAPHLDQDADLTGIFSSDLDFDTFASYLHGNDFGGLVVSDNINDLIKLDIATELLVQGGAEQTVEIVELFWKPIGEK